jgi:hypothetical protein
MNTTTRKIRNKGYTLKEFCDKWQISLRTYRRWEKLDSQFNSVLNEWIDAIEYKS